MSIHAFTFYSLILRNSRVWGDRTAWLEAEEDRACTYSEYRVRVDSLASALRREGVRKGDRIAVLAKNSLDYFVLFGAAAALGAVVIPINWRLSPDEVLFILRDGNPRWMFTDAEYQETVQAGKSSIPSVQKHFSLGGGGEGFADPLSGKESGPFVPEEVGSDDVFTIIYTAAVAGRPRGALLSHANVLWADMSFASVMGLGKEDVHLHFLPFFHVGGLFMATTCFQIGGVNVHMKKFEAADAVETIRKRGITFMMDFAPILSSILDEQEKQGKPIPSLQAVTGIDTAETIERYQKTTGGSFFSLYGQTETSCLVSLGRYSDRPGSAGSILPVCDVQLLDEMDQPVAAEKVGEIAVRGPMVFQGYWNLPEETAYTFRDGWHHTGDLGRLDEGGYLWYAGRKAEKELIKPGGENVYPAEVEKAILQHPSVEEVVVFGVPDPKWKEGIKAVCRLKPGARLKAEELIAFVGGRIARYKKPQYVEFVADLPRRPDGSVDRARVKAFYGAG